LFPVTRHLKVPGLGPRKREASLRTLMGLSIQTCAKYYRKLAKEIAQMK